MRRRRLAFDEELPGPRADATLRALAQLDSLEPAPSIDRAVLAHARAMAHRAHSLHGVHARLALRWALPAAVAAATVCAIVISGTASRTGASNASHIAPAAPAVSSESRAPPTASFLATENEISTRPMPARARASMEWVRVDLLEGRPDLRRVPPQKSANSGASPVESAPVHGVPRPRRAPASR